MIEDILSEYNDDDIEDLAKDDPELHTEVELNDLDNLDDSDEEVDEAPEAGKTDDAQFDVEP